MKTIRTFFQSAATLCLLLGLTTAGGSSACYAEDSEQAALNRSHEFLKTSQRGQFVLNYVHAGARYQGHEYRQTLPVTDHGRTIPGEFALVYRFYWENDGVTDVAFLCDAQGDIGETQIVSTNAVLQQPFLTANATIQILANVVIEVFKEQMSDAELKQVKSLVSSADAHGLMDLALRLQQ